MSSFEQRASGSFPKDMRLRKRSQYLSVQRTGTSRHSRYVVVVWDRGCGRLGITVSKKVGNAVVRNRVRRVIREFARKWGLVPDDLDVVVIARAHAAGASTKAIWADLSSHASALRKVQGA